MAAVEEEHSNDHVLARPVGIGMLVLAVPVLVEQLLGFGVGMVDTYLAAMSADATTAVGSAAYVGWLASLIISFIATGTTALVARHWGANERQSANLIANRSMAMAVGLGLLVFGFVFTAAAAFAHAKHGGETYRIVVAICGWTGWG